MMHIGHIGDGKPKVYFVWT